MCDCMPDHYRYNFPCKRKGPFWKIWASSLEFTIIHFWIYMIFLGVLIAFVLKTVGCYMKRRGCKQDSRKQDLPGAYCSTQIASTSGSECGCDRKSISNLRDSGPRITPRSSRTESPCCESVGRAGCNEQSVQHSKYSSMDSFASKMC